MYNAPILKKSLEVLKFIVDSGTPLGVTEISNNLSVSKSTIYGILNTTMTHIVLGLDPKYIMLSPYTPVATIFPTVRGEALGINVKNHVHIYFFPCVASYVGGDIVAGVLGSGVFQRDKTTLFMDIGTNGEIVLGNKDWLVCASCSAGPAFEGGGIKFGMRAGRGAIEQIRINPSTFEPMTLTIGRVKPMGICGSGLIDLVAELIEVGLIDQNGKFKRDVRTNRIREGDGRHEYVVCFASETCIDRDIVITEMDIDNLMRAKAAMYAGCKVLLDNVGLAFNDVDMVIISGGFQQPLKTVSALNCMLKLFKIHSLNHIVNFAACIVFSINIVIVIGPTPPGTGVIADAFSLTPSKSTSPHSFAFPSGVIPILFTPTSITTAPSFTMSAVIAFGLPAATMRISARFV